MGESANLAFYAMVYAKGLVPRERLQDAMHRATLESLPMEQVLLQWGLLTQPQVDELVGLRRRLGRACASCKKLTYLLQDQSEASTPCEHCGGQLQPPRRSARMQRPGQSSARNPRPGQSSARTAAPDLNARLALAEERILAKALESVETRLAQEDLTGFLKAVVKKASQAAVEAIAPQMEELQGELERARAAPTPAAAAPPNTDELVQQVLERVRAELPQPDGDGLVDRATQSAIEAVQEYDLGSLPDRVAQQVLERLEAAEPSEALIDAVVAAVGPRGEQPAPELSADHLRQLLAQLKTELDAKISEPDGLAEQMAQHVLEKIPGLTSDSGPVEAELSPERLAELERGATQAALAQVEAQVEAQVQEVQVLVQAQVQALVESQVEAQVQAALGQLDARIEGAVAAHVDQRIQDAMAQVHEQLDEVLDQVDQRVKQAVAKSAPANKPTIVAPASGGLSSDSAQAIMDNVETRLSEFDMAFDAVIMEATEKAVEAMEARLAGHAPAAGSGDAPDVVEVTREATAQVMRVVETRLAELPAGGQDVDEQRLTRQVAEQVLGVVEARLAGLQGGGGGGGGEVDLVGFQAQIMKEVEDRLRALPTGSAGTETASKGNTGVYDRKFIALAREVKQLKDSVSGGGGGTSPVRQSADLLNSEEFRSLLEARINQALSATGTGTPGAKKGGELVGLLNTPEFKQVFDQKINQVLTYVKGDLIPSAVKKAMREVESS